MTFSNPEIRDSKSQQWYNFFVFWFLVGSRRPSILPVPDMFTSSSFNIASSAQDEGDESEDELEDEVPWRSPSEKIAYVSCSQFPVWLKIFSSCEQLFFWIVIRISLCEINALTDNLREIFIFYVWASKYIIILYDWEVNHLLSEITVYCWWVSSTLINL